MKRKIATTNMTALTPLTRMMHSKRRSAQTAHRARDGRDTIPTLWVTRAFISIAALWRAEIGHPRACLAGSAAIASLAPSGRRQRHVSTGLDDFLPRVGHHPMDVLF